MQWGEHLLVCTPSSSRLSCSHSVPSGDESDSQAAGNNDDTDENDYDYVEDISPPNRKPGKVATSGILVVPRSGKTCLLLAFTKCAR